MPLSENIYRLRSGLGLSQSELAERLDVSRQSVSKWELGSSTPELDKLIAMSELFSVTLDALVHGEEVETPKACPGKTTVRDVPIKRFIVGCLLFAGGVIIFFLMFLGIINHRQLLDTIIAATVYALPLLAPGLACMVTRTHVRFTITAAVYAPLIILVEYPTSVGAGDLIAALNGMPGVNDFLAVIFLALIAADAAVIAVGIRSFRSTRIEINVRRVALALLMLAVVLLPAGLLWGIVDLNRFYLYRLIAAAKHILFSAFVIYAVTLVRTKLERKA